MAVTEGTQRFQDLRLDTGRIESGRALRCEGDTNHDEDTDCEERRLPEQHGYLDFKKGSPQPHTEQIGRLDSLSGHTPTPPIPITIPYSHGGQNESFRGDPSPPSATQQSQQSSLDDFLQNRRTSITFDPTLKLDCGARQHMEQPLQRSSYSRTRGRSLLGTMAEFMEHQRRAHSESDRNRFDPVTGEPLPQHRRNERDGPHVGQLRHPLLPSTVDELARESQNDPPEPMTSDATLSPPEEEVPTPPENQNDFLLSPVTASPIVHPHSYEEKSTSRRIDRSQTAAADFFSRAGSLHKSPLISTGRQTDRQASRRSLSSSTKSPKSAASSYLASFSASRRSRNGNGNDFEARPASPDAEGQTVGDDYVLGKQIGFGGFSVIKEAFNMRPDGSQRKVAVKIVRRNIEGKNEMQNEQVQAEFDHEVDLWRFLRHPRILPLEAIYKTEDATFCFIPLNTGGTLFDLVRANRSGLPSHLAKRYAYQLATAIRYLHEDARVAHRDIKLENCLLDTSVEPPNVRVCDFGMAEWITNDSVSSFDDPPSPHINSTDRPPQRNIGPSDTSTSAFAGGSLEYAAPEIVQVARSHSPGQQREAERGIVSPASDIWALGVCIYTLIVGSRPFQDSFQPRVVMAILAGDWDHERLVEKGGEDALDLVAGCLEMDIHKRWDINEVLGSAWMREEDEKSGDQDGFGAGAWALS
jgi:serine/threonine protein kinase